MEFSVPSNRLSRDLYTCVGFERTNSFKARRAVYENCRTTAWYVENTGRKTYHFCKSEMLSGSWLFLNIAIRIRPTVLLVGKLKIRIFKAGYTFLKRPREFRIRRPTEKRLVLSMVFSVTVTKTVGDIRHK